MATKTKITEDSNSTGARRSAERSARLFPGKRRKRISPRSSRSALFHASAAKWRTLDLLQVMKKEEAASGFASCVSGCTLAEESPPPSAAPSTFGLSLGAGNLSPGCPGESCSHGDGGGQGGLFSRHRQHTLVSDGAS